MLIDDFHSGQAVPLVLVARAGMPTLPYVEGNSWVITDKRLISTDPPSATVAAHPWARRPERWANSRPLPLVCFEGAGARREPHDDREIAGSHAGSDDRSVCAPCPGFHPERCGADHREHRREPRSRRSARPSRCEGLTPSSTVAGHPGHGLRISVKARQQLVHLPSEPIYAVWPRHGMACVATIIETHRVDQCSCLLSKFTQYRRMPLWQPMNEPRSPRYSTA